VDVELADWERLVGSLSAESGAVRDPTCAASTVGAAAIATGVSGVAASCITGDGTGSTEGASVSSCCVGNAAFGCWMDNAAGDGSLGAAVATAGGTSVWSGVAETDAVVSLLDVLRLVCAPPELCTTPERGSGIEAPLGAEVELPWAPTELCAVPDVEPDEETAAEADDVDDVGPVDDVPAPDSDDELVADDDESYDELVELVSVGSANATPGVFATAAPTPRATTHTPTRTMDCAFTAIAHVLATRPSTNDSPSRPV